MNLIPVIDAFFFFYKLSWWLQDSTKSSTETEKGWMWVFTNIQVVNGYKIQLKTDSHSYRE